MPLPVARVLAVLSFGPLLPVLTSSQAVAAGEGRDSLPQPATERTDETIDGQYIVVFRETVDHPAQLTDDLSREHSLRPTHRYGHALKGFSAEMNAAKADALSRNPRISFVAPDRKVYPVGTLPIQPGDTGPTGIQRVEAATTAAVHETSPVNVAVIDTGVDLVHPDLNAVAGTNCIGAGAPTDDDGHGTHVAGTIAAKNNGAGVVGASPGTKIYAVKVLGPTGGTTSQVVCGIDWVTSTRSDGDTANDIAVANMSLGGTGPSLQTCSTTTDPMHRAICNSTAAGVTYVVAAGNERTSFDSSSKPKVPAVYPEVLTVTAMGDSDGQPGAVGPELPCYAGEPDDEWAVYSNWASTNTGIGHTIAGPGTCINSTVPGGGYDDTYSGTSMATPHVAGVVALCIAEGSGAGPCAGLSAAQIVQKVRSIAQDHTQAVPSYGFLGSPENPVSWGYYGYLAWVGMSSPTEPADTVAPAITSTSPVDGATEVAPSTKVDVTFSEAMNQPTAEGAFSLANAAPSTAATLGGTFSWAGNTMTFTPSPALADGTSYTATVGTGATDTAGNPLPAEETWSFTTRTGPPPPSTLSPSSTTISKGSPRSGTAADLAADDSVYYEVNSSTSSSYTTNWFGKITGVPNDLASLTVRYAGKNSRSCTQTLWLRNWTTSSWVQLDSRSVGTTEVLVEKVPTGTLADYVSGSSGPGELRPRVQCKTTSGTFFATGDLMQISYTGPADTTEGTDPPPSSTLAPSGTTISKGSLRSGTAANLAGDDDVYYEVNSSTSSSYTTNWFGKITGVPNDLTSLAAQYRGKNSRSCTQTLWLRNWTTSSWVQLDSRSVGTTEVLVDKVPTGTLADYVSGSSGPGELRLRVQCKTTAGTFFASGDLMQISYTGP